MIPKTIHQIWIGDSSFPEEYVPFRLKWQTLYWNFEHVLWDHEKILSEGILSKDKLFLFNSSQYPIALKADVVRYEILRQRGGWYVDVDMEPLRKMEDSIGDMDFVGGIQCNGEVAIGFIGSAPNSSLMTDVCKEVIPHIHKKIMKEGNDAIKGVDSLTGPVFFDEICKRYKETPRYLFLEPKYLYPYWYTEMHRRNENFAETCPEAYAVHHWTKNWFGKQ